MFLGKEIVKTPKHGLINIRMRNPEVGVVPRLGMAVRAGVATAVLLAAGCSSSSDTEVAEQRIDWEVVVPGASVPVEGSVLALDQCASEENLTPIQQFDSSGFYKEDQHFYIYDMMKIMDLAQPDASPQEYADHFIEIHEETLAKKGIKLEFHTNYDLVDWRDGQNEFGGDFKIDQKRTLLLNLDDMIAVLEDYPDGMLPRLGINKVLLADSTPSETTGGHFIPGEIQVEYSLDEDTAQREITKRQMYKIIAHEVAHGLHYYLCDGSEKYDQRLGDGVDFIGRLPKGATREEAEALFANIPPEQLAYGKERVFPNEYSATLVTEYFASIMEFTMEQRGLIMPGDADFESPLYYKQQMIVERIEHVLPGFTEFLQKQTVVLRHHPNSEIYNNIETVDIAVSELPSLIPNTAPGERVYLNGATLADGDIIGYGGRDEAYVTLFPRASKYQQPDGSYNLEIYTHETNSGLDQSFTFKHDHEPEMILLQLPGDNNLFIVRGEGAAEAEKFGMPARDAKWVGTDQSLHFLAEMYANGARPVKYKFIDDNFIK